MKKVYTMEKENGIIYILKDGLIVFKFEKFKNEYIRYEFIEKYNLWYNPNYLGTFRTIKQIKKYYGIE